MAKNKKSPKDVKTAVQSSVFFYIFSGLTLILLVIGSLALWANKYTTNMVRTELAAQKIFFPENGSPSFSPEVYPDLQKYAGQQVDSAQEAKAYANGYIGRHLAQQGGGKTYSEISTEARKNPSDEKLQALRETMLQGETLRGVLLSTGFAFGTVGELAGIAAYALYGLAALTALGALWFRTRM